MFDGVLPEVGDLAGLDARGLVDAAGGWARVENAACARKLAAMAEIFVRRTGLAAGERELWWVDPEAAVSAELAAAQNISRSMALHQTHRGVALRDRLPKVAALFEAGLISDVLVRAIVWRTYLITRDEAMADVDADLAGQVTRWGALSVAKTEQAIDALVDRYDPGALRRSRDTYQYRDVAFGSPSDEAGFTSVWARLYAPDAVAVQQRVEAMARSVCAGDPRTLAERRADALGALAAGTELACTCGHRDCGAGGSPAAASTAIVHVIADAATVAAARGADEPDDPEPDDPDEPDHPDDPDDGPAGSGGDRHNPAPPDDPAPAPAAAPPCPGSPAVVVGGGILPASLLGAILGRARVRELRHPGLAGPEPRYRPSRGLADFVRCRDLTCRFPGCDRPATGCDLDHTVAYPVGPTHASNLKCLCRFHHLLKTFWCGRGGWRDRQLPDGTIIWTAPTGHTYATYPASKGLFPTLCTPTATLWEAEPPAPETTSDRAVMMPTRRHTRAHNTAKAITAERRLNDAHVAERNKPPPF
jgi:hypothetical protein